MFVGATIGRPWRTVLIQRTDVQCTPLRNTRTLTYKSQFNNQEKNKNKSLAKEKEKLTKEIARATGMLSNEKFISKAPEQKIQEEKDKLEKFDDNKTIKTEE